MSLPTIVIIAPAMGCGGSVGAVAWRHAVELSQACKVFVITRDVPEQPHPNVRPILLRPRSFTWLHRFAHVPTELAFLLAARHAMMALAKHENIDLLWCHSHALTALVGAPLKTRLGYGLIMTTHGDIFDRPAGTYSRDLTLFYKAVTPRAYREADLVHALSSYMGNCAVRGGAKADQVRVIPNGVAPTDIGLEQVVPRLPETFMPNETLRLLFVGSLWSVKGGDILIRAAAALRARSNRRVVLTLIGEGVCRKQWTELAASLGSAEDVQFVGQVARGNLARYYAGADVLCIPSLSEALPTVAMEAMLCGLPVVGSNTGGIPMLVQDGSNGYLAIPGEAEDLVACLTKAGSSREHLAQMGGQGLHKVRAEFSWREISQQLNALARDGMNAHHAVLADGQAG